MANQQKISTLYKADKALDSVKGLATIAELQAQMIALESTIAFLSLKANRLSVQKQANPHKYLQGPKALVIPVEEAGFNARALTTLKSCKILADVVSLTRLDLLKIRDCGVGTISNIKDVLRSYDLWLGFYETPKPF
jgi:DNA-directed RNA polymerase alpha subunit